LVDDRLKIHSSGFNKIGDGTVTFGDVFVKANELYKHLAIPNNMPLLEGIRFELGSLILSIPRGEGKYVIHWSARAPKMLSKMGMFLLETNGELVNIKLYSVFDKEL